MCSNERTSRSPHNEISCLQNKYTSDWSVDRAIAQLRRRTFPHMPDAKAKVYSWHCKYRSPTEMKIAFFSVRNLSHRYQASNFKDNHRAGRIWISFVTQINLTFQGVIRFDIASRPVTMNETFRCGVSGFREVLKFEFLGNTGKAQ